MMTHHLNDPLNNARNYISSEKLKSRFQSSSNQRYRICKILRNLARRHKANKRFPRNFPPPWLWTKDSKQNFVIEWQTFESLCSTESRNTNGQIIITNNHSHDQQFRIMTNVAQLFCIKRIFFGLFSCMRRATLSVLENAKITPHMSWIKWLMVRATIRHDPVVNHKTYLPHSIRSLGCEDEISPFWHPTHSSTRQIRASPSSTFPIQIIGICESSR